MEEWNQSDEEHDPLKEPVLTLSIGWVVVRLFLLPWIREFLIVFKLQG